MNPETASVEVQAEPIAVLSNACSYKIVVGIAILVILLIALSLLFIYQSRKVKQQSQELSMITLVSPSKNLSTTTPNTQAIQLSSSATIPDHEVINGISVPPEPDEKLNNSTLAGVDINNNGVRDDVERIIAKEFGNQPSKFQESIKFARIEQAFIASPSDLTRSAYLAAIPCTTLSETDTNKGTAVLLNTPDRQQQYGKLLAGASWGDCK